MTAFQIISVCNFLEKRDHIFTCMFSCYSTLVSVKNDGYILVLGKNPPGKSPPDPKPNPIPNLTLNIPLTPYGGLFPGGIFSWHRIFWIDLPCKESVLVFGSFTLIAINRISKAIFIKNAFFALHGSFLYKQYSFQFNLIRCYLMHITIIVFWHILYLVYLC